MDLCGFIVSVVTGVATSLVASFIFARIVLRHESTRLRTAAKRYVGTWEQQGIADGKPDPFDSKDKCSVEISQPDPSRPEVVYVKATEAKGDVWEGEAVVNRAAPNRATLVWAYTISKERAWFGTYELYLVDANRIFIEPSAVAKEAGHHQSLLVRS